MHGQRVGQEQESNGGESASRALSGGAGQHAAHSMRWDGLAGVLNPAQTGWVSRDGVVGWVGGAGAFVFDATASVP